MPTYSPNPEYADLPFAWPRSYGTTRNGRGWSQPLPRLLVVHHTAGNENAQAAESGASYDQVRLDGTSAHYYIDPDSIVQCVPTWMRANTAFYNGNTLGIHYELCGTLQTREQWLDGNSRPIIARAAAQMRRDAAKYGIPIRRLTVAQVRAGEQGICGHADITAAFPQDNGTHTDPGPYFPWDVLLADIAGDDMLTPDQQQQLNNIHDWLFDYCRGLVAADPGTPHITKYVPNEALQTLLARPPAEITEAQLDALADKVADKLAPLVLTGEQIEQIVRDEVAAVLRGTKLNPDA